MPELCGLVYTDCIAERQLFKPSNMQKSNEWGEEIENICQKRPKQFQKALPGRIRFICKVTSWLLKNGRGYTEKSVLFQWRRQKTG